MGRAMSGSVANLKAVEARIAAAEGEAGRDKGSVQLVAVSKTFGPEEIRRSSKPDSASSARTAFRKRPANGPSSGRRGPISS